VFYFVSAVTYFLSKEKFIRNWFIIIFAALLVNTVALAINDWNLTSKPFIPGTRNHLYFSLGIVFYCLYNKRQLPAFSYLVLSLLAIFTLMYSDTAQTIALPVMIALFLLFIYKEQYLAVFKWRFFTSIGLVSYSLYLIHENIGVVLLNKLTDYTGVNLFTYILPLFISALFFLFSIILFNVYEKPVDRFLKQVFRKQLHPLTPPGTRSHLKKKT
jgi:peptidoglycan/LPS O-acetylase OafA/YrhL